MDNRRKFAIHYRNHNDEGYAIIAPWWQIIARDNPGIDWYPAENGGCDYDQAAQQGGHRLFIFASQRWLSDHQDMTRFVVGLTSDLVEMRKSERFLFTEVDGLLGGVLDPLRHVINGWDAHIPIATVTRVEFHEAFGENAWTSKFPRS